MADLKSKISSTQRRQDAERFIASASWKKIYVKGTAAPADEISRMSMRIFAEGCPEHSLREVHEALARKGSVTDPEVNGVVIPGTWFHKSSIWTRNAQLTGSTAWTIIWDLSDGPVSETNVLEHGCGGKTTVRFEWDRESVEAIETIANYNSPGFEVQLGGVSRDQETGRFNYYVTTSEQYTVTAGVQLVSEDSLLKVEEITYKGLRPGVTSGTYVDHNNAAVTLWAPTAGPVAVSPATTPATYLSYDTPTVQKNDRNCTYNVSQRRLTAKKWSMSYVVPDAGGSYTRFQFANYLALEVEALRLALGEITSGQVSDYHNSFNVEPVNRFGLYDGQYVRKLPDWTSQTKYRVEARGLKRTEFDLVGSSGDYYIITKEYTYEVVRDWGISGGYADYAGAKEGSSFSDLGGDWYSYIKVTDIKVAKTAVTLTGTLTSLPTPPA